MNRTNSSTLTRHLALMALVLDCVARACAQSFTIDWFTIDGGGTTSTGGIYSVSGTIGQPDAGVMTNGQYSLVGGFWGVTAIQTPGAPLLSVMKLGGAVVISWPRPADGFLLEGTGALSAPPAAISWSQVPFPYLTNATHIYVNVPMPTWKQFYRLRKN